MKPASFPCRYMRKRVLVDMLLLLLLPMLAGPSVVQGTLGLDIYSKHYQAYEYGKLIT